MKETYNYRRRSIRKIGNRFHAFVNKEETSYIDLQSAKAAIDEMLDRRNQVDKMVGAMRSVPFENAKSEFITSIQSRGLSEATHRNYLTFFRQIEKMQCVVQTMHLTADCISRFLSQFPTASTRHTYYMAVRGFVRFCLERNYLVDRKVLEIKVSAGQPTKGKRPLTDSELMKCSEWMDERQSNIKLLWRIGIETGVRTREAVLLRRCDFNVENKTIVVNSTKTSKKRHLLLSSRLCEEIVNHMSTCNSEYLVSHYGKRYTEGAVQSHVKRMRNELMLSKDIGFYSLRKRASNIAYAIGGPSLEASMMGHTPEVALTNYINVPDEQRNRFLSITSGMETTRNGDETIPISKDEVLSYLKEIAKDDKQALKQILISLI